MKRRNNVIYLDPKRYLGKRGFTLIEVVVVMAIIAVLATLVVGAITIARTQALDTRLRNDARTIKAALEAYYAKNNHYVRWFTMTSAYDVGSPNANYDPISNPRLRTFLPNNFPWYTPAGSANADVCYSTVNNGESYKLWVITAERADNIVNTDGNFTKCNEDDLANVPANDNYSAD